MNLCHVASRASIALLLVALVAASGCEALALGTIATAFGIAGSAVGTGGAIYKQGKLDSAEMATVTQWTAAIRKAADDLHLHVKAAPATLPSGVARITLADDKGATIELTVEPRTPALLLSRISVGLFGSEPTARLLLSRIRAHAGVPVSDGTISK